MIFETLLIFVIFFVFFSLLLFRSQIFQNKRKLSVLRILSSTSDKMTPSGIANAVRSAHGIANRAEMSVFQLYFADPSSHVFSTMALLSDEGLIVRELEYDSSSEKGRYKILYQLTDEGREFLMQHETDNHAHIR